MLSSVIAWAGLTKTEVSQLYVSIFGRASEGEGNAYWGSNQSNMVTAADMMLDTDPAKNYFGTTLNDNQSFIQFIYKNTLGKTYAEDHEGVDYWVSELENGKSKGQVIATLINAAMDSVYTGLPAQDQFINKVKVCNYTADAIATCPDVNDLSLFVDLISAVTEDYTTVIAAKGLIDIKSIKIIGNNEFITQTEDALALLQNLMPNSFEKVQQYVGMIEQGEHSGMWAYEDPPKYVVSDTTAFFSVTWYAGTIAHDATHSELYHEYLNRYGFPVADDIWSGVSAEIFCIKYQIDVMEKINAPQFEIQYLNDLDGTHCDIDGDGDCDWDDYNGRDW